MYITKTYKCNRSYVYIYICLDNYDIYCENSERNYIKNSIPQCELIHSYNISVVLFFISCYLISLNIFHLVFTF
uniref:Chitin-binding type-2 domain-containing protein n=1 Tax=Heterorhabditis bacteriophora TaxID=37862 RepID=A0A1I7W968_HETBA